MKQLSRKEQIANFVYKYPMSNAQDIAEALYVAHSSVSTLLAALIEDAAVIRHKDGRYYRYTVTEGYAAELAAVQQESVVDAARAVELSKLEKLAEGLEARGMRRRAATVWAQLSGMQNSALGIGLIALRRNQCIRSIKCQR